MPKRFEPWKLKRYAPFVPNIPPPEQDYDECPKQGICVNETWIPLIMGALQTLTWADLYAADPDRAVDVARQATNLIIEIGHGMIDCECDMSYLLRQNPNNPCQLEQSTDNGLTWTLAFDYGLCLLVEGSGGSREFDIEVSASNTYINNQINIASGNYLNVYPDLEYDNTPDDDLRNSASCFAFNMLVAQIAAMEEKRLSGGYDWKDYAKWGATGVKWGAGIVMALAQIGTITVPPAGLVAATVAGVAAAAAEEFLENYDRDPDIGGLLDDNTQRELICCAVQSLTGSIVDLPTFSTIFDGCENPTIDDDSLAFMQAMVASEKIYMLYLDIADRAFDALQEGQTFDCPCDDWEYIFEFTTETGNDTNTTYGIHNWVVNANAPGNLNYVPESGIHFADCGTTNLEQRRGVDIHLDGVVGDITSVTAEYDAYSGIAESTHFHFGRIDYGGGFEAWTIADMVFGENEFIQRNERSQCNSEYFAVATHCSIRYGDEPEHEGSGVLKRIVVRGKGDIPSAFLPGV